MGKSKKELASLRKKIPPYSPVQIKEGELLTDVGANKWKVGKPVGSGGFGEIYSVSNDVSKPVPIDATFAAKIELHKSGPLFVEKNFYIRVAKRELIDEWKKTKGLKHLGMPYYISFGSHMYQNEKYRFLILQRFSQDLGKLFIKCKKKFHIKTVLTLGIQILDILEYIHSHGYIHADIKDSNLLLGSGKDEEKVYLLDYGLACRYVDSLGAHKDYNPDQRKAHDGTLQYTSRDAHVGAHSRRSDLEVLAYNMIHWLSGSLPWNDELTDPEKVAKEKEFHMNNIPAFLKKCFGENPPAVLIHFLKYVVSLKFDTEPDYEYCKTLLRQGIRQAGYVDDGKLNFNSTPAKLKNRKRKKDSDVENWMELKPVKVSRNTTRQPCVPVQANFNRMTRQQTAANSPALRSRETFDWIKVLQSDPEKILKTQNSNNDQIKKKRIRNQFKFNEKPKSLKLNLKKEKDDPLENPTPAILEVLKLRSSSGCHSHPGKRTRSESHCCSPVFYDNTTLTPAMEEVIRRREMRNKVSCMDNREDLISSFAGATTRSNRSKSKSESQGTGGARKLTVFETKATSAARKTTKKYLMNEQKSTTAENSTSAKSTPHENPSKRRNVKKHRKLLPALPKYPNKKMLGFLKKEKIRRREVSPSEIDFVPRLRSGFDNSEDMFLEELRNSSLVSPVIRNYAAKSSCLPRRKRSRGLSCGGLSPVKKESALVL